MKIEDGFEIDDKASGLKLKVIRGIKLDRLHIEHTGKPMVDNRDFFFTREGEFDGTGSAMDDSCDASPSSQGPIRARLALSYLQAARGAPLAQPGRSGVLGKWQHWHPLPSLK